MMKMYCKIFTLPLNDKRHSFAHCSIHLLLQYIGLLLLSTDKILSSFGVIGEDHSVEVKCAYVHKYFQ